MKPWLAISLSVVMALLAWSVQERRYSRQLEAITQTVSSRIEKLEKATQARGHVSETQELMHETKRVLGVEVARPVSLVTAEAVVPGGRAWVEVPAPGGVFHVEQVRNGPALTGVDVAVEDGTASVLWKNKEERFKVNLGQWRTEGDGMRAAVNLSRTVGGQAEELPVVQADAYFAKDEVLRLAPLPRYAVGVGVGRGPDGKPTPNFVVERYLDRRWSVQTGYINGGPHVMVKATW